MKYKLFKNPILKTIIVLQTFVIAAMLSMDVSINCDHCNKPTPAIRGLSDYYITEVIFEKYRIPVIHFECFDCYIHSDGEDDEEWTDEVYSNYVEQR